MAFDLGGLKVDPASQLHTLERTEYEDSLYLFLRKAWRTFDPADWQDGWPIEAIAEHLQAVVDGDIKRLVVNIPPRCCKSGLCSVALPAWTWAQPINGPTSGPGTKFLYSSYATQLSLRDSRKCRTLIESPWYQDYWGNRYDLNSDQNTKSRFSNTMGGERLISSITAANTGEGGDIIVIDDANSAKEAASEVSIEEVKTWWDQTMSTRLNDPKTGAYIVVQQRLAEDDLTGHILSKDHDGWTHLMLPMKYEPERSFSTLIGWKDPRTVAGQLLWPERFGPAEVKSLESSLGPWGAAGQLQQRPEPAGGGVIKREWWKLWEEESFPPMDFILASLDTAFTLKETNDPSAMTVWGVFSSQTTAAPTRILDSHGRPMDYDRQYAEGAPKVMLMYAWRERLELHELVKKVEDTCKRCKVDLALIENKASGISVSQELRRLFGASNFGVQLSDPKSLDKLSRLYSVQHLFSEGMIYAPDKTWADMTITEVAQFPRGKHDDLTDTCSQALRHLRDNGLMQRAPERLEELESMKAYTGRQDAPLYAV